VPHMKRSVSRTNQSEEKVRARIRRAFSKNIAGRTVTFSKRIEDEILALMKEYAVAGKDQREMVYSQGEKRILRALRSKRV